MAQSSPRSRSRIPIRKCRECKKRFRPSKRSHLYHDVTCKGRAAQRRRRKMMKLAVAMAAGGKGVV